MNPVKCPKCGSEETRQHTDEKYEDVVLEEGICESCGCVYVNRFHMVKQYVRTPAGDLLEVGNDGSHL